MRVDGAGARAHERSDADVLAVEEPLEIRLAFRERLVRTEKTLSVTMRTPGDDVALAVGFLLGEGIVRAPADVANARHCGPAVRDDGTSNVVKVELSDAARPDLARLERHVYTTSSCGVCGKTSLDAVRTLGHPRLVDGAPVLTPSLVHALPASLRRAQAAFERTGGLHAAALFDAAGELSVVREDVGRHNAVDKVLGGELLAGRAPCSLQGLLVSGRASFELVQKALMAGVAVLVAVGAPSSLAVQLARESGMTLVGFARDERFNVYADPPLAPRVRPRD